MTPADSARVLRELNENLTCIQHGGGLHAESGSDVPGHRWIKHVWRRCQQKRCPACDRKIKEG